MANNATPYPNGKRRTATQPQPAPALTLIRAPEAARMAGCSTSNLWRMVRLGRFPKPVKPGPMITAWVLSEVQQWVSERIAERDGKGAA